MARPLGSIFAQALALVLVSIGATLALGLGVLAFRPPPPPATVSIAAYVEAWRAGSDPRFAFEVTDRRPELWSRPAGTGETVLAASLARGVGLRPADVKLVFTAPALFGLMPRSGPAERGQITIIDLPAPLAAPRNGATIDINAFLLGQDVRVPPFIALFRQPDGRYLRMEPRERWPTAWQSRLLATFALALLAATPLVWLVARRWTEVIRRLATRVARFDVEDVGRPVTGARDADEVKALEQAFEVMHDKLRGQINERMQMLMAVAHDLRTPLTSLRIRSEDVGDALRPGFLRDVARLEQMIDGILAFARARNRPAGDTVIALHRLVDDLVGEARARGEEVDFDAEPVFVAGNAVDLARAVDNLLGNAARYAGRATVRLRRVGPDAELSVIDDGPGVPEALLPRLTEPFFRVESSRSIETGGIGLGLATVKAIVEAHGGALTLENAAPGFCARITLPARDRPDGAQP